MKKDARLIASEVVPEPEVKLVGKATVFKPLSVARRTGKKKKMISSTITVKSAQTTSAGPPSVAAPQPPKPKVSLFSISRDEDTPQESYPPEPAIDLADDYALGDGNNPGQDTHPHHFESAETRPPPASSAGAQSLDSLATSLDLDAATRRQLFGRNSKSNAAPINLVNFNTDQEYAANEERRAAGETIQHNAVRTIAPGKHSLKQLVNAATSQRDALEESWAAGRKNKRDAGARYGW
jgi:hypothetical protein